MRAPSALTRPVPATKNSPVLCESDHISTSEPGVRPEVLGNVIGAGWTNVRPMGCTVSTRFGPSVAGSALGVKRGGTADSVISPA